jgi:hypothetical protein
MISSAGTDATIWRSRMVPRIFPNCRHAATGVVKRINLDLAARDRLGRLGGQGGGKPGLDQRLTDLGRKAFQTRHRLRISPLQHPSNLPQGIPVTTSRRWRISAARPAGTQELQTQGGG